MIFYLLEKWLVVILLVKKLMGNYAILIYLVHILNMKDYAPRTSLVAGILSEDVSVCLCLAIVFHYNRF